MAYFTKRSLLLIALLLPLIPFLSFNPTERHYEEGKASYIFLKSKTEESSGASCMGEALGRLNATCASLNDTDVSQLALRFTICHYQAAERQLPEQCIRGFHTDESLSNCTKNLDGNAFVIYTQFFTHTLASCYFIEAKLWQEKTEKTIFRLGNVADDSARKLEESLEKSDQLIDSQDLIFSKASELSDKHDHLHEKMDDNQQKMEKLSKDIGEYYSMVSEILSALSLSSARVEQMISLVLGETHQLSSFIFYFILIIMTFLLTVPSRTNKARMKMVCILVLHFLLERILFSFICSIFPEYNTYFLAVTFYTRFFIVLSSLFLLVYAGYHYKDYDKLLRVINRKLDQERMENEKFREDIRNEIKINRTSLHENFESMSTPILSANEKPRKMPCSRAPIHRSRERLNDEIAAQECVSHDSTPWKTCPLSESSAAKDTDYLFSPVAALEYDSGVEDLASRRELQLSIPRFNISTASPSPLPSPGFSTPKGRASLQSALNTSSRYNLRQRK